MEHTLFVQPTTGGRIQVNVPYDSSVSTLKMLIAKQLKVPKDRIVLLHRNKQLIEGSLVDNQINDGSKLTLLPNIETGTMTQNPEQCVMKALETLNETQVDNFLAGRSPLNLTMRLGDHMMFIQLQLSTFSTPSTPPTTPISKQPPTPPESLTASIPVLSSSISSLPSPPPSPGLQPTQSSPSHRVLTEASRNLAQTLKQLSSTSLAKKMKETCNGRCCVARKQGGAVIESMYHHGKGVFSGTFSGTLSPFLQDKEGRPQRNICTVVHILNDLLGASSHCNPCNKSSTSSKHKPQKDHAEPDGDENCVLRAKMERIQTLLKERRQKRREVPYARKNTEKQQHSSETAVV